MGAQPLLSIHPSHRSTTPSLALPPFQPLVPLLSTANTPPPHPAETTLIPFSTLPACAASCGPLYDVNGACVPPNVAAASAAVYENCFCSDTRLVAFSTATAGVCDSACTATPADYGSITSWYQSLCSSVQELDIATTTDASGATTTVIGGSSSSSSKGGGGGGW